MEKLKGYYYASRSSSLFSSSPGVLSPSWWCKSPSYRVSPLMLCRNPYLKGDIPFGCGQCLNCRVNLRRIWTHRVLLESYKHEANSFVTLTYAPEHLPAGGTLVRRDVQLFLKRLRRMLDPLRFRYYGCGEYGDNTLRPHYHVCLFGVSPNAERDIAAAWNLGHIHIGEVNTHTASYCAGYVTKKMTGKDDPRLPRDCVPEFSFMSLKPGIGAGAVVDIGATITGSKWLTEEVVVLGDVPGEVRHGAKKLPLGRYLKGLLREEVGFPDRKAPPESQKERLREMQALKKEVGNVVFKTAKPFVDHEKSFAREHRFRILNSGKRKL